MQRILNYFNDLGKSAGEVMVKAVNTLQNKDIFIVLIIILVAFGSFGLGRLSKIQENKEEITVEDMVQANQSAKTGVKTSSQTSAVVNAVGIYVASKNGTKYYLVSCPASNRISEANKIWFNTKEEAEKAGFGPAANCPGL